MSVLSPSTEPAPLWGNVYALTRARSLDCESVSTHRWCFLELQVQVPPHLRHSLLSCPFSHTLALLGFCYLLLSGSTFLKCLLRYQQVTAFSDSSLDKIELKSMLLARKSKQKPLWVKINLSTFKCIVLGIFVTVTGSWCDICSCQLDKI